MQKTLFQMKDMKPIAAKKVMASLRSWPRGRREVGELEPLGDGGGGAVGALERWGCGGRG